MGSRFNGKTKYYETLNLKKDCSAQEIKESFISLSKKYHPDSLKNSTHGHEEFLQINEAYSVLSKAVSRREYDTFLQDAINSDGRMYYPYQGDVVSTRKPSEWKYNYREDESFWEARKYNPEFSQGGERKAYYGIKGVKKVSNGTIVALCCLFAVIGAGAEFYAVRNSLTFNREKLAHESARNSMLLEKARSQAKANGIQAQLDYLMQDKLIGPGLKETTAEYWTSQNKKD